MQAIKSTQGIPKIAKIGGVLVVIALFGGLFAAINSSSTSSATPSATGTKSHEAAIAAVVIPVSIKTDTQHARKGSDGVWHDAFLPADYSARVGQKVTLQFSNSDDAPHSMYSPDLKINVTIPGASDGKPGIAQVTFVPTKSGDFHVALRTAV